MSELDNNLSVKGMVVFRKAMRTIDAYVSESYRQNDLTPMQFSVLDVLYSKGEMKISELVGTILATSGNMTVVVKNMERDGLIYRQQSEDDRRAFLVGITEKGEKIIRKALPDHIKLIEEAFSILDDQEKADMIEIMKKFKNISEE
jgi:DNA-binding MarR family transcriptional regulator